MRKQKMLKQPAERRARDTEVPELWAVVTSRGKSWRIRYRRGGRTDISRTIGSVSRREARRIARVAIELADAVLERLTR